MPFSYCTFEILSSPFTIFKLFNCFHLQLSALQTYFMSLFKKINFFVGHFSYCQFNEVILFILKCST